MDTLKSQWRGHIAKIDSRKLVNCNTVVNMKEAEKRIRELPPRNYLNQMVFPVKSFKFGENNPHVI